MVKRAKKTRKMPASIRRKAAMRPARKVDKAPEIAMRRNIKIDEDSKKLFLDHHLPQITRLQDQASRAQANLRNGLKSAKKDGFLKRDFDVAFRLRTETGEKDIRGQIARDCTVAGWMGYKKLGDQLDLFLEAGSDDVEAVAYADGEEASRTGQPAKPLYAPGTPGYDAFMRGFGDHQTELHKAFKKKEEDDDEQPAPSGVAMTRSQFRAQQTKQAADAAEERSLFSKKQQSETAP